MTDLLVRWRDLLAEDPTGCPDPDSFVREHGARAMREVLDAALPIRAELLHRILVLGELPPGASRPTGPVAAEQLLNAAAHILSLVQMVRERERDAADELDAPAQRAALSAAVHGRLSHTQMEAVPVDAFTGAARLLVWTAAMRTVRVLGAERTTPARVWRSLGAAPLGLPRELEIGLLEEAAVELEEAARMPARDDALDALTRGLDARSRGTLAALLPVLDALDKGAPMLDTAARLRAAADLFEGRQRGERRAA